jgi:hypothetical protein
LLVHIQVNVDAAWGEASVCANAHHACIALNEWQFDQFSEIVHFRNEQLAKPWGNNPFAIKVIEFGGVHHDFGERAILRAE